ncbi:MAG: alpha-L-fucosidase [Muribaculaceae bacterium]|nr:alpha-L-fucosidase [Muribaculaceae bacterium]
MRTRYQILMAIALVFSLSVNADNSKTPEPCLPVPSPQQVEWQRLETYAFIHFGPNTFTDKEWGFGDTPPEAFNPTRLDCEQWVQTVVKAGMKGIILTCKHHDGFCLWHTKYTDYSVANSPFRRDVVRELSDACRKYGIKFGVYLSPWDRHQASYGTAEYVTYYYNQLEELMTQYGDVFEVWFDGANGGDGWYGGACEKREIDRSTYYNYPKAWGIVNRLQPSAVIFSDGGPGCRWVGNEKGFANPTNWSFLRIKEVYPGYPQYEELQSGHADGDAWCASECNTSIRPGWFYHESEDDKVKTVDELTDLYYRSVGHNGTFLLNFPVDREGLIHPTDSATVVLWRERIDHELGNNLLVNAKFTASDTRNKSYSASMLGDGKWDTYWAASDEVTAADIVIETKKDVTLNRIILQEYIPLGQRVKAFVIEYKTCCGKWVPVITDEETTTIGYKRIVRFAEKTSKEWRIRITDARACPCINNIEGFYSDNR